MSELTTERLAAIKAKLECSDITSYQEWEHEAIDAENDIRWLIAEVERLRQIRQDAAGQPIKDDVIADRDDTIYHLGREVERLHAENAKLRAAIEAIEWVPEGYCPWCFRWGVYGHSDNCQRQLALGSD